MGKMAKALGLGVKGSLQVVLDRARYTAGDLVHGSVVLRVAEPIECSALVLRIRGKEAITWTEGGGQAASVYLREHEPLNEEILLSPPDQSFQSGEYIYPIVFQLDETLQGSYHVTQRNAGVMCRVDASLSYCVKASMTVKGSFSADLETKQPFLVLRPALGHPVRALQASTSAEISLLQFLSQGSCSVSAALESDVHIAGDMLLAQASIRNDTSRDMTKLSLQLYEDLTVRLKDGHQADGTTCVCRQDFPGVRAGQTLEQVLHLPLVTKSTLRPIPAAFRSHFLSTTYRLVLKCRFRFCRSVSLEFPVVVLRKVAPGVPQASAAAVLPAVASAEAVATATMVSAAVAAADASRAAGKLPSDDVPAANAVRSPHRSSD